MSVIGRSLRAALNSGRDLARERAARILFGGPKAFSGSFPDRLEGLEPLLSASARKSVLDIGCCEGLIAWEFARRGARRVHGFDRDLAGVLIARRLFRDMPIEAVFETFDLAQGARAFEEAFSRSLEEQYDIVLFLGVYHHLARQMAPEALDDLMRFLARRSRQWLAVRTDLLPQFEQQVVELGFTIAHSSPTRGNVGMLHLFERA